MAFKCMTGLSPEYLSNKFISKGSISGQATRNSQKLNIPLCKSATGQRSFYYRIVSIWNAISPTLKLSQCVSSFKCNLVVKINLGHLVKGEWEEESLTAVMRQFG